MASSPPLPISYTKNFQQQQKKVDQIQNQQSSPDSTSSTEPSQQQVLAEKYNSGKISLQEFQQLFPELLTKTKYGGTNATKSTQAYISYLSSRGLSTKEAERSLPESSYAGAKSYGQKSKPSTQYLEGGYSSIYDDVSSQQGSKGVNGFFSQQKVVQAPIGEYSKVTGGTGIASYTPQNGSTTNLVGSAKNGGYIQSIETKQVVQQKQLPKNQDYYFNTGVNRTNDSLLDSVRSFVPENTKQSFRKEREGLYKVNSMTNEFVNDVGQGLGSTFYEIDYASKRNSFFNQDFYKNNFVTRELKPKSEVDRGKTQAIFSDVALKAQYFIPVYGELKIGSDIIEQTNKNNFDFVPALAFGGVSYLGLKAVGKGLTKIENLPVNKEFEFLSPESKLSLDKIYDEILITQKPSQKGIGKISLKENDAVIKSTLDVKPLIRKGSEVLVGGALLAPIVYSSASKANYITSNFDIGSQKKISFQESSKEARLFGSAKFGYELTEFGALRTSRYVYEAKAILSGKTGLPEEQLISPQVKSGETSYPKATMNAKAFKRFFEQSSETPLAKKYFEPYSQGFNVSKGKLPKEYLPEAGTSEFSGQYFAPRYPSTTFGIPKGSQGSLEGYSLLPKFDAVNGPPVANVLYGKGVRLVDVRGKGKDVLNKLDPGYFYVPTKGKLRSKSESEAIQNINTLVQQSNNRYYFIEKTVAKQRGFGGGVFFEVPEYKVAGLGQNKTLPKNVSVKEAGVDLRKLFAESDLKSEKYYGDSRKQPITISYDKKSNQKALSYSNTSYSKVYVQSKSYSPSYQKLSNSYSSPKLSSNKSYSGFKGSESYGPSRISSPVSSSSPSYSSGSSGSSVSSSYSSVSRKSSGVSYSSPYYSSLPKSPPPSLSSKEYKNYSKTKDYRPGFLAVLYKGGKAVRNISNTPLIRGEAIALGANYVNPITKRSFKLQRAGVASPTGLRGPVGILRLGKRDKNLFVEKSRFAINTGGEKRQLKEARQRKASMPRFSNKNFLFGRVSL